MAVRRLRLNALVLLTFLAGCNAAHKSAPVPSQQVAVDPWVLVCNDPSSKTPAVLWNGLIGLRIGRDGTGNGQSMFDIDEYDTTGEEKIKTLPNPLTAKVAFDPAKVSGYSQTLDMRTGILKTSWKPDGKEISVETVLDPEARIVAQRWSGVQPTFLRPQAWADGTVWEQAASGDECVLRIQSPHGANVLTAAMGLPAVSPIPPGPMPSFSEVAKRASNHWAKAWRSDIEIDGPIEDQLAVHSFLFYLRSAIQPDSLMAISPFGLSNDRYGGHVFWDADIWVFPALSLVDPEQAKTIPEYRLAHVPYARKNFDDWLKAGRPTATGSLGLPAAPERGEPPIQGRGLKFPWESSVTGKETVPGPSKFEDHITGSVAWGIAQAGALGLVGNRRTEFFVPGSEPVTNGVGVFWGARRHGRDVPGVVSPDENHAGDNDLYTNILANWAYDCAGFKILNVKLPRDEKSLLTYDGDPVRSYKQAAAVLAIYPLQYPEAEKQAKVMMERFADKVSKNGPAMSDSVHALIWARLGEQEKGYGVWKDSWQAFTNHPLMLFSEKRTKDDTYFTTGAAGCLQTVLYGFLGFRIDSLKDPKAAWAKELKAGRWLSVTPHLPQAWKSVKFKNFSVLGTKYTLTATHQGVTVTPGDKQ